MTQSAAFRLGIGGPKGVWYDCRRLDCNAPGPRGPKGAVVVYGGLLHRCMAVTDVRRRELES